MLLFYFSYFFLEMVVCGNLVVMNFFGCKIVECMVDILLNILVVEFIVE